MKNYTKLLFILGLGLAFCFVLTTKISKADPITFTLIIEKQTEPDASTQAFDFTVIDPLNTRYYFTLLDGKQYVIPNSPGVSGHVWIIEETLPANWILTSVATDDPSSLQIEPSLDTGVVKLTLNQAPSSVTVSLTNSFAPVPEPATMLLFGAGLVGIAGVMYRKKRK